MEDENDVEPSVNFIPCLVFVQKGVAKENPDKVPMLLQNIQINNFTILFMLVLVFSR